jgi:hypothetical protein
MSVSTTPPTVSVAPQKKGMGCLGCGCLIVSLLVLLFLVILGSLSYVLYHKIYSLTSNEPEPIVTFDGGDNFYAATKEKIDNFTNDLRNHQASRLELSGDEINALLTRDPYLVAHKMHFHVTLSGDRASVQGVIPTGTLVEGIFTGRYVNFTTSFGLDFKPDDKVLNVTLTGLQVGDMIVPETAMQALQAEATAILNSEIQKRPELKIVTQQARTIAVKSGSLVIQTQ